MIPPGRIKALYDQTADPKEWKLIPEANHFWGGQEKILSETVVDFFKRTL
jgi:alpha/beta superfamily hydrolase